MKRERKEEMTNKLEELVGVLKTKCSGNRYLDVKLEENKVFLTLDLGIGIKGTEIVHITPTEREDSYELSYMGIFDLAFETFLDEKRQERIKDSVVLERLKDKTQEMRRKGEGEIHDSKRDEFYSRLFFPREPNLSCEEARKAMSFFADVFVEKTRGYATSE